jgi:uncharacterized membrane protein
MKLFKLFSLALICVFTLDMIWLGIIAKSIYSQNIGSLLRKSGNAMTPNWSAAAIVYVAIVIGIIYFVLPKANGNYYLAALWGIIFGAVSYGIYDFTNFSILANWPLKITLIDFVWGMILCGLTSLFTVSMQHWLSS